jgi:Na+-driven multidrug efflux pump
VGVNGSIDILITMPARCWLRRRQLHLPSAGAGKTHRHAREVLSTCYFIALVFGLLAAMALGLFLHGAHVRLLGANDEVMPYSIQVLQLYTAGGRPSCVPLCGKPVPSAEGSAIYSMIGMVSARAEHRPGPAVQTSASLGVTGASAATAISKRVSWTILMLPTSASKRC